MLRSKPRPSDRPAAVESDSRPRPPHGRFLAIQNEAEPIDRANLLAALGEENHPEVIEFLTERVALGPTIYDRWGVLTALSRQLPNCPDLVLGLFKTLARAMQQDQCLDRQGFYILVECLIKFARGGYQSNGGRPLDVSIALRHAGGAVAESYKTFGTCPRSDPYCKRIEALLTVILQDTQHTADNSAATQDSLH